MKYRIFISFLVVAFFNYINGCTATRTERISPQNLVLDQETIEEIVLTNFDVIEFDDNGARYTIPAPYIAGKLRDGKEVKLEIDHIKEFRISTQSPIELDELKNQRIREILLKNNLLVAFDEYGASYNENDKAIVGRTNEKQTVNIKIERVSEIYLEAAKTVDEDELSAQKELKLTQVLVKSNLLYVFDQNGGKYFNEGRKITGRTAQNKIIMIDPDSVLYANVQRSDVAGTILANVGLIVVILGVAALIVAATKQSCPFIYSFDGEKYVFDAEPLGGATTKGLERTEYSKMEYLKNTDDNFRILVRNEVEETQYIDELSLLAVISDDDKEVVPDLNGNFYQIKDPYLPLIAKDERGLDLRKVVNEDDNLFWQTKLPVDSNLILKNHRHELTFTFARPNNETKAKLIANIGTSLWGSRMIREMLQLYGNTLDSYYDRIDQQGNEYRQMMDFIETEELYKLKYYIQKGDEWVVQGFINGGGPLVSETRAYDLDLTGVTGDSVNIKVYPPFGYWTVDYLAIQYDEFTPPKIEILPIESAIDQNRTELKEIINNKDGNYCIMPFVGDYFEVIYKENKNHSDSKTSYYLKSAGYYEIHLNKELPFHFITLSKFITEPGFIIKYTNERYREWEELNN